MMTPMDQPGGQASIRLDGVSKRYGARPALTDVSFTVAAGEITGLLGPNGAGKSTALSIVATLLAPDTGRVEVAGHRLPDAATRVRRVLGLVPQRAAIYPTLTATENLRFFARMYGLDRHAGAAATARALALVGLDGRADEPVARFSGGMARRLNIACGILHGPRIVLLDEPTVGVDPQSRERIFDAVAALAHDGAAVLYSTHYMEEAERLCQRVILLDAGRVVSSGTPAALVAGSGMTPRLALRTTRPLPADWCASVPGATPIGGHACEVTLTVPDGGTVPAVLLAAERAGATVTDMTLHHPNLADVFFALTGRELRDDDGRAGPTA